MLQAQGHGFRFTRVHGAEKVGDWRIVREGLDAQPPGGQCFANPPGPRPTGVDLDFPMDCGRNQAVAEQAGKQLQPLDSGQGDQRASVRHKWQVAGVRPDTLRSRRFTRSAHEAEVNSSSSSEGG